MINASGRSGQSLSDIKVAVIVICDFLELDEKKERLCHIMMCYVESRSCPFTVVANKTKLRKE